MDETSQHTSPNNIDSDIRIVFSHQVLSTLHVSSLSPSQMYYEPSFLTITFLFFPPFLQPFFVFIRIEICAFSGAKIYPGKGKIYVRVDNRVC